VSSRRQVIILRIAALLALVGLVLMVWAVLAPTPLPVMLAMSAGQGAGTLSFLLYLFVVVSDLRRAKVFHDPPPEDRR
jgi:hypothetical protein